MTARLTMAMIGGAPTSMIGPVHRAAAAAAGIDLVAGVFSGDRQRSLAAAAGYGVDPVRCYPDPAALFAREAVRPGGIDLVVIATPNHLHLPAALAAVAAGVPVVCDKPLTATLAEARQLAAAVAARPVPFAMTYSYTGFPLVRAMRAWVAAGAIGRVRKVVAIYLQGWLARPPVGVAAARAGWRTDPARSGSGGTSADLGTHAFNLIEYVTGDRVTALLAEARPLVAGRVLDDDCHALMRLSGGGSATLVASQVAIGEGNALSIAVYGEAGAMTWAYERPNELRIVDADGRIDTVRCDPPQLADQPASAGGAIVPALAAIYRDVAAALSGEAGLIGGVVPDLAAGVRGLVFVDAATQNAGAWVALDA